MRKNSLPPRRPRDTLESFCSLLSSCCGTLVMWLPFPSHRSKLVVSLATSLVLCGGAARGFTVYMQDLGSDFVPAAANELGHLVGHRLSANRAAWRLPNGEIVNLGTLGGVQSRATAISDDATTIVGWAHNSTAVQNAFRYENGDMISVLGTSGIPSQAFGLDAADNVYLNRQSGTPSVRRWNRSDGTVDILLSGAHANGVNQMGDMVGKNLDGTTFKFDGSSSLIQPATYNPVAGIGDTDLSAGSLSSLAAFHRPGDAMAQTIPGIVALGSTSTATGLNGNDVIVGNAAATVFLYSVANSTLTDLNAGTLEGANAFYLLELYGITDDEIFFGKYIDFGGQERYFRGSLTPTDFDSIPGDFDTDGDVDGRDFLKWQRNPASGDLADWQGNYGVGALSALGAVSVAVPEPGISVSIFALSLWGPLCRKRL